MIVVGTATSGEKEIKRDWPIEKGLTAGTQKQEGRKSKLEVQEENQLTDDDLLGMT